MDTGMQRCVECESDYVAATSQMYELCPECAHYIYGYPNCEHTFDAGRCMTCRWDGSRSKYIRTLAAQAGQRQDGSERSRRSAPRTTESNRDVIRRLLFGGVRAGHGRWAEGPSDDALGAPVFEYEGSAAYLCLWEHGLTYESAANSLRVRYSDVERFEGAPLRELAAAKGAATRGAALTDPVVTCALTIGSELVSLSLPLVIYTGIYKPLSELISREQTRSE